MSIKVKIKTPDINKIAAKMSGFINSSFVSSLNTDVIPEIKKLIDSGQSPVAGFGRFAKYKDKLKYPGKKKSSSPVNLKLTGDMLSKYNAHQVSTNIIGIGYDSNVDQKTKDKAEGNNIGANGIPLRRFIPQNGESFTVSVMRKLKDVYARRIAELFK